MTLTVLLPLKNYQPQFLTEALNSIFRQTRPDWRMVIITEPEDAASLRGVLADALEDARIRLVQNRGRKLAGAFNTGMREAETKFVAILLADDMWAENAVAVLEECIGRFPDVDFFHSARRIVNDAGQPISSVHRPPEHFTQADFISTSPVKHLLCWRREKALSFGGMDESLNSVGPDDWDFPWSMLEHGAVFKTIGECLYIYRDHRDAYRLSTHLPRSDHLRETRRILRKHGVGRRAIARRLRDAKRSYLRQCLYRNRFDRWLKQLIGRAPQAGWRDSYQ
jgi:glycosyltransferase involved in cell wall biosynthesis